MLRAPAAKVNQEDRLWCGAACCEYILKMLGVHNRESHKQQNIMNAVQTLGMVDWCGSTPASIADYILNASRGRKQGVQIYRLLSPNEYAGRLHIWALKHALEKFEEWDQNKPFTEDQAVLRFVTPQEFFSLSSHFVVETHFFDGPGQQFQLMDPDPDEPIYQGVNFDDWLRVKGTQYQSTSLDLVIAG